MAGEGIFQVYVVAFILAVATGLFYAAGTDGLWSDPLCVYGGVFCDHPAWLAGATIMALLWAKFVSI
jgi:hypothetical protein